MPFVQLLHDNPELAAEIEAKIRAKIKEIQEGGVTEK